MDEHKKRLLSATLGHERLKFEEPLTYHSHINPNVLVECFYIATDSSELIEVLNLAFELKLKFMVIGSGSKIFFKNKRYHGLVIKNRTGNIKISGVKGKVGRNGLGIEEAMVEADSGVSIGKLNGFLREQKLQTLNCKSVINSTLGGSIFFDPEIKLISTNIKVWEKGDVVDKNIIELKRKSDIILSVILKVKSAN